VGTARLGSQGRHLDRNTSLVRHINIIQPLLRANSYYTKLEYAASQQDILEHVKYGCNRKHLRTHLRPRSLSPSLAQTVSFQGIHRAAARSACVLLELLEQSQWMPVMLAHSPSQDVEDVTAT